MPEPDLGNAPADLARAPDLAAPDLPGSEVPRVRGSLVDLIDAERYTTVAGQYGAPTAMERDTFRAALALVLRGEGEQAAPLLLQVGYTLTDFTDDVFEPVRPRRYYVLQEREVTRRYRGLYLFRRDAAPRALYLEAPYGNDRDIFYVQRQCGRSLLGADAAGLLLNTVDRCADASAMTSCQKCSGTCVTCGGTARTYFPLSDMGGTEGSFFHVAHEVLSAQPGNLFLSVNGHIDSALGYVVSDGTRQTAAAGSAVLRLRAAFATLTGLTVRSCNDGSSTQLCGEALLQGRHTNGAQPVCTGTVTKSASRFFQIQQLYDTRRYDGMLGPGEKTILAHAILSTWP